MEVRMQQGPYTDQMQRTIRLPHTPKRIVSIVPSQTELLFDLGLDAEVCGITKFCVHPDSWFRKKTRVGGTKILNLDTIRTLQPDLIIGNKEENSREQIELLMHDFPVWMSDVKNLDQALDMIRQIGLITNRKHESESIVQKIGFAFDTLHKEKLEPKSAAYLIWNEPPIAVGRDTFIHDMMMRCGFINIFQEKLDRYPQTDIEELKRLQPELILLSSEPFPFKKSHAAFFSSHLPASKIVFVDGESFSWYGSRLRTAPEYFRLLRNNL